MSKSKITKLTIQRFAEDLVRDLNSLEFNTEVVKQVFENRKCLVLFELDGGGIKPIFLDVRVLASDKGIFE